MTDLLCRGVLITDGEEHDRYRELMEPPLHPSRLPSYTRVMVDQTDRVSSTWQDGNTVDMLVESRKIAMLIILQTLFSRDAWEDLPRLWDPILKAIQYISPGMWIMWRNMPRPGYRKHLKTMDEYLYGIITERRKAGESASPLLDSQEHTLASGVHADLLQHLTRWPGSCFPRESWQAAPSGNSRSP